MKFRAMGVVGLLLAFPLGCGSSAPAMPKMQTQPPPPPAPQSAAPLATDSPWPKFRRDALQTGRSPVAPPASGGTFFAFSTGAGVFSSPVVGGDGTVYVGSADRSFYALNGTGGLRWKVATDGIIDSSALLDDQGRVYFGSGDGKLRALDAATGALVWTFGAEPPTKTDAFIDWFEGNVAIAPDGTLYVPNDDYRIYAVDRAKGTARWTFPTPDQTWSSPAVDAKGNLYFGNNELLAFLGKNTYAVDAAGKVLWEASSPGTVAASPLVTASGLMILGGFDGFVHAYDLATGDAAWSTPTRDHVYASAAELPDGTVVVPSADGTVYGLDPKDGSLVWTFDTPEPIRSSPAVDAAGHVYVGGGDGTLYVLEPTGALRWSMRLIDAPRRNLNSSPALGASAVYLGGESGAVFGVPYDDCLRAAKGDPRCSTTPPFAGAKDGPSLLYTEAFGGLDEAPPAAIDANQALAFTLRVLSGGRTELAILDSKSVSVEVSPKTPIATSISGDGKFFTLTPSSGFVPDAHGRVTLTLKAKYLTDLTRTGLKLSGGKVGGSVAATFSFSLTRGGGPALPLPIPVNPGDDAGVLEVSRIALPLPTILPSYNQIGFDQLRYLIGFVEGTPSKGVAWMVGAKQVLGQEQPVVDPATQTLLPLVLAYGKGLLTLSNTGGLDVDVMGATIPLDAFRIAARLDASGVAPAGAGLSGETVCSGIPTYGVYLETLGFCNPQTDVLTVFGASNLGPWASGIVHAPKGVGSVAFAASASAVTATLTGSSLKPSEHVASVLLIDAATGDPVSLSYGPKTKTTATGAGVLETVTVPLPAMGVPKALRVYLMVDAYPAARGTVTLP